MPHYNVLLAHAFLRMPARSCARLHGS